MTLAEEIRAETKRILARHFNSVPDAISAIRVSTVEKIDAYVADTSERLAACTCQPAPTFTINTRRHNGPLDAQLTLKRFKRMDRECAR